MTRRSLCFVVALLFVPFLSAKDKAVFPKQIVAAQYVLVTTYFSDNLADPSIPPADRQAVIDVQNAIRDWGRYTLVYDRKAAELIFLVRKGRTAETRDSIHIHGGSNQPTPSFGHETQGDVGDPQDMLAVFDAARGTDTIPIWRDRITDGLNSPKVELVRELRTKVEAAAKNP
jgi:hypothetical protein